MNIYTKERLETAEHTKIFDKKITSLSRKELLCTIVFIGELLIEKQNDFDLCLEILISKDAGDNNTKGIM